MGLASLRVGFRLEPSPLVPLSLSDVPKGTLKTATKGLGELQLEARDGAVRRRGADDLEGLASPDHVASAPRGVLGRRPHRPVVDPERLTAGADQADAATEGAVEVEIAVLQHPLEAGWGRAYGDRPVEALNGLNGNCVDRAHKGSTAAGAGTPHL